MLLSNLLKESLDTATLECWQRERTATLTRRFASRSHTRTRSVLGTPVRAFAVHLHAAGLSLRETETILHLLGRERSFQVIFQWVHRLADSVSDPPTAQPRRVVVDEAAVKINGKWSWLYAAIDLDTKVVLDIALCKHHGTDPAAAFLHGLYEKYDCSETVFLADAFGHRTAFSRLGLHGRVDYTDRNLIEKWLHTFKMRVDRFHNLWVGSRLSVRQWLAVFVHYYDFQRPHRSLNGRTPTQEVN